MKLSKMTFKFDVGSGDGILLYNSASGAFDLISRQALASLEGKPSEKLSRETAAHLLQRGHATLSEEDDAQEIATEFEKFKEREKTVSLRFVIIPTYRCNSRCAYCFLAEELENDGLMSDEVMDSAFSAIDKLTAERGASSTKQLSVFGGEPLIDQPAQRRTIDRLLGMAAERDLEIDIISNGNDLLPYVDLLSRHRVAKIQVTFDGLEDYHNLRRKSVDRKGESFTRIVAGVDAALAAGIMVNGRIHLTKENVETLPSIADFFQSRGWISNPKFTSHIGTVFDCFRCMPEKETRRHLGPAEGNRRLADVLSQRPDVAEKLELDWQGVRRLVTTGQFFPTTFRTCYGGSRTFAFDLHGGIYICETTAGKPEYRVGDFHPEFTFNSNQKLLDERNVLTIDRCRNCTQMLVCAGGCAFNAHVNHGSIADAGCRKMTEAFEYGLKFYWPQLNPQGTAQPEAGCGCNCG